MPFHKHLFKILYAYWERSDLRVYTFECDCGMGCRIGKNLFWKGHSGAL